MAAMSSGVAASGYYSGFLGGAPFVAGDLGRMAGFQFCGMGASVGGWLGELWYWGAFCHYLPLHRCERQDKGVLILMCLGIARQLTMKARV